MPSTSLSRTTNAIPTHLTRSLKPATSYHSRAFSDKFIQSTSECPPQQLWVPHCRSSRQYHDRRNHQIKALHRSLLPTNHHNPKYQQTLPSTTSSISTRPLTTSPQSLAPPPTTPQSPTPLTPSTYNKLSDTYIDTLLAQLESLSESREDIDVEYSAGVLTLIFPPHGTYVLNKQPPNRQIWLSSPISSPKRFDWVGGDSGGGGDEDGDGGGKGEWVYLRDGSTLSGVLEEEIGVKVEGVAGEE